MDTPQYRYSFTVQETDLDVFGHMNNARYLTYFEQARWDLLAQNGWGIAKIRELGVGPTILGIELEYRKELVARQKVTVETTMRGYEGKIMQIIQEMKNEQGDLCSRAVFKCALFDLRARKLIAPTAEWLQGIGAK